MVTWQTDRGTLFFFIMIEHGQSLLRLILRQIVRLRVRRVHKASNFISL